MTMTSLQQSDAAAAAVAVAPRVKLGDIEAAIAHRFDTTGARAVIAANDHNDPMSAAAMSAADHLALQVLSVCILVLHNGFTVIGKSAPASPENFDRELGRRFAYEDAVRQLWPLLGFAMRERLHLGLATPPNGPPPAAA